LKGRYGRALAYLVEGLTAPLSPWRRANTRLRVATNLAVFSDVETRYGRLTFLSTQPEALRVPLAHATREPETLRWIEGFEVPAIYWDVGANVGEFALHAARRPGVSVVAFEPSAANYAAFCRNIEINRLDSSIQALCLALGGQTRLGNLNLSNPETAGVFNSFESDVDCFGEPLDIRSRQSAIGFSIDDFREIFRLPAPNYLKIDVDGTEEEILDGAKATLSAPALCSVLIEMVEQDPARNERITARLKSVGFTLVERGVSQGHASTPFSTFNGIFARP